MKPNFEEVRDEKPTMDEGLTPDPLFSSKLEAERWNGPDRASAVCFFIHNESMIDTTFWKLTDKVSLQRFSSIFRHIAEGDF